MRTDFVKQATIIKARTNNKISSLLNTGAKAMKMYVTETGNAPAADSGVYAETVEPWVVGKEYKKNDLFSYNGNLGYVKQPSLTAQEIYPPFSVGTEALYGARPAPNEDGIYPYAYNMAADVGMKVLDPDDGKVYECIQLITDMLYKPHEIPAHFEVANM